MAAEPISQADLALITEVLHLHLHLHLHQVAARMEEAVTAIQPQLTEELVVPFGANS